MKEANFDGIVGNTHNYAGLSFGNVASEKNAALASNPRAAALQGLEKMRLLHSLGVPQGVFPPQPRPNLRFLAAMGFSGSPRNVIARVARVAPELLPICYSSSGMWAANAATVTPSIDTANAKVHFTPANLSSTPHRALEAPFTAEMLKRIFAGNAFCHHEPLPPGPLASDEGAANHMRMRPRESKKNIHIFVYGREGAGVRGDAPFKYPARQTRQSVEAIARVHEIDTDKSFFIRQHSAAIDAGVFHNDVISLAHEELLLYHELAFADEADAIRRIKKNYDTIALHILRVSQAEVSLQDAVSTYLFNSQLVSVESRMVLIAPQECAEHCGVANLIQRWVDDPLNPIKAVHFVDLRQSMQNGGGPACLRLRVPLEAQEWNEVHVGVKFNDALYTELVAWIGMHYRDKLQPTDLADPELVEESLRALEALQEILQLNGLYDY